MPPPPQQACSAPGCEFLTPENVPSWELVTQQLSIHQKTAHPDPVPQQGGGGHTAKIDKKIRPSINPQMTEEGWRFFIHEWQRYRRQTAVQGQILLDELWSCMSEELRQLAFAEGGSDQLKSEIDMLKAIKKLAVVTLHSSVHVIALHELRQQSDENVQTFAARVKGISASCGLNKECPGCKINVSFSEETCYHVVLSGLNDQSMKERALTQAMMETITDLNSLITWCTADEGGRLGTPGSTINRLKQSSLRQLRQVKSKCGYCGGNNHGDSSRSAREKECKAFGKTCSKCQKKDHFPSVCKGSYVPKSSVPTTSAILEQEATESINSNGSLTFFAIQEAQTDTTYWRPWEPPKLVQTVEIQPLAPRSPAPLYAVSTQNRFSILYLEATARTPALATPRTRTPALAPARSYTPTLASASRTPALDSASRTPALASASRTPALASARTRTPPLAPARTLTPALAPARTRTPALAPARSQTPTLASATCTIPALAPATARKSIPTAGSVAEIPSNPLQLANIIEKQKALNRGPVRTVKLSHILHDVHKGWLLSSPRKNPYLQLDIQLHLPSYKKLGLDIPSYTRKRSNPSNTVTTRSVMDTGAQMALAPTSILARLGLRPESLLPLQSRVAGASSEPIHLLGGILVKVTGTSSAGHTVSCLQLLYISDAVKEVYMSLDACIQLNTVPSSFPSIEPPCRCTSGSAAAISAPDTKPQHQPLPKCSNTGIIKPDEEKCCCPSRTMPPSDRPALPCSPTVENLPLLKNYILQRFASSAFNTCERQPLPLMTGSPPLRLFVDPEAKPVAAHKPAQVPLHWKNAVKGGLDRDVRLGVLEKVDVNVPVEWCSRMVVTPKPNSDEPRRVVDFQPLNLHAPRQTHHTQSPWSLVSSVPAKVIKSTLDCWHGYHSVEIEEIDRPLTTFVTEWGRYRYRTAPQGFLSAGDGYTQRSDIITAEVPRLRKCVDDSLLYDDNIEANFFRVCDYLELCAKNGMIFNSKKFQFGSTTVQYLGFMITPDGIQPTDDFLGTIKTFPTPKNITDVRSWFGCIAQIAYTFSTTAAMEPFRHLLSSKSLFQCTPALDIAFEESKQEILRQCMYGVKSFDASLPTALATDWSKLGIGFWLCQQHCSCKPSMPGCCPGGWQTVYCGSRFCSPAEANYAPIEGEGLAATWGLEKCKFFLLGMKKFILALDHRPLISIFGQQAVMNIPNPRLTSQKIKTMLYSFQPVHVPGKQNVVPDCLSRSSDSPIPAHTAKSNDLLDASNILPDYKNNLGPPSWVSGSDGGLIAALRLKPTDVDLKNTDEIESLLKGFALAALAELDTDADTSLLAGNTSAAKPPAVLTWPRLEAAAAACPSYRQLQSFILTGAPEDKAAWPDTLLPYRPVIPAALRAEVLDHLHAANSGVTAMYSRATSCMYWPNMRDDIVKTRANCSLCNTIAPSNPAPPPHPMHHPAYPFSDVCADFCEYSGKSYLVIVDRYSNWISIFQLKTDTSANIIKILRNYSMCWGVPQSFSSDGASNFVSTELEHWLKRWGINHRVSSYYYPRSNKRAELGVKSAKRIIMNNLGPGGSLDTDKVARALLQHRNCPDPITGLSPAQVIFGRVLRDHLPLQPGHFAVRSEWRLSAELRERALAQRHLVKHDQLSRGSKLLSPLLIGDTVMVQDQSKQKPGKWTKTGTIVEVQDFDSYLIKIDGSNNVTKRNRRFLRKITPYIEKILSPPPQVAAKPALNIVPQLSSPTITPPPAEISSETISTHPPAQAPDLQTTTPPCKRTKLPPHLREKWILAPPLAAPSEPYADSTNRDPLVPPPPGTQHNYDAMEQEAIRRRKEVNSSLTSR